MGVRKQQGQVERPLLEFGEQRLAKFSQTGASIEDDDVGAVPDLNAGGVSAVTIRSPAGRWN
jgi:hypothetical protein